MNRSIGEAAEAAAVHQRKTEASPQRADFEREFGKERVRDEKDGSWTLTLHERDDIKKAHQMQEGVRRLDIERGEQLRAKSDGSRERMYRPDGRVVEMEQEHVGHAKAKLRSVGRNGGAPSLRFGLSDSYGKYEQGPDGLWFVWNDGWEPTRLWEHQAKGEVQRDPDGNVWVREHDGEWVVAPEEAT